MVLPKIERYGPVETWIIDDTSLPKKGGAFGWGFASILRSARQAGKLPAASSPLVAPTATGSLPLRWRSTHPWQATRIGQVRDFSRVVFSHREQPPWWLGDHWRVAAPSVPAQPRSARSQRERRPNAFESGSHRGLASVAVRRHLQSLGGQAEVDIPRIQHGHSHNPAASGAKFRRNFRGGVPKDSNLGTLDAAYAISWKK
jgi:hypothetical protein